MIQFGTGGWRAVIGEEFTKDNVQLLAAALCTMMEQQQLADQGICVGYDRRFLSQLAAQWLAEVCAAMGVPCLLLDREAPTPLIMFTVQQYGLPYGIAVTASHNPAIYNGIKVFTQGGRDATQEVTAKIEGYIARLAGQPVSAVPYEEALRQQKIRKINPFNGYIDSILSLVDVGAIKDAQLKIALDPMYGVSRTSLQTILLTARCEVDVIHERHDTLFGGRLPSPSAQTLTALSSFVVEKGCDLGIATDGDADRIGVIDDTGAFLHPNKILVLLYYYLHAYRGWRGAAVRNNSTTHLLDRVAAGFDEDCFEVPVGFKHVSAKMEETDALIGGESSGGLTVRGHIPGKDGIYAAALLVEMVARTGQPLSAIYRDIEERFGASYTAEADCTMTHSRREQLLVQLFGRQELPPFPYRVERVSYRDGCKVYFQNGGWVICRFSGTEPLLRICAEMPREADARQCVQVWQDFLAC